MISNHKETIINFKTSQNISPYFALPSFWIPDLINLSAWIEHAPFAFWLVNATKPNTIVELGVHHGFSYFAFCQAVEQLRLSTRCYAIDTWKGDEHSGFYGDEVFKKVNMYNSQKYSGFSQLIRSTFDDALAYFLDKSIDILHIDGRHFYEDVKHDFTTWLPKLSDRAVVLLHDINVKERQFGVFKLWEELRQNYPHFEFIHGHGLGVLGVGKSLPAELDAFFAAANTYEEANIRFIYSRLGAAVNNRYQLASQTEQTAKVMMDETKLRAELALLKTTSSQNETSLLAATEANKQMQVEISNLKNQLARITEILKNEEKKQKLEANLEIKNRELLQFKNQLSITETALEQREYAIEQLGRTVNKIYSSRFWRLTLPLRKLLSKE